MTNDLKSSLVEMYREHMKTCETREACDALSAELVRFASDLLTVNDAVRVKASTLAREGRHE